MVKMSDLKHGYGGVNVVVRTGVTMDKLHVDSILNPRAEGGGKYRSRKVAENRGLPDHVIVGSEDL